MTAWQIGILMVLGFIMIYLLVDRICMCVERCNMASSYASTVTNGSEKNEKEKNK